MKKNEQGKEVKYGYAEALLLIDVIKSTEVIAAYKSGYIPFMISLKEMLEDEVKRLSDGDDKKEIQVSAVNITIFTPQNIIDLFNKRKLEWPAFTLDKKYNNEKENEVVQ